VTLGSFGLGRQLFCDLILTLFMECFFVRNGSFFGPVRKSFSLFFLRRRGPDCPGAIPLVIESCPSPSSYEKPPSRPAFGSPSPSSSRGTLFRRPGGFPLLPFPLPVKSYSARHEYSFRQKVNQALSRSRRGIEVLDLPRGSLFPLFSHYGGDFLPPLFYPGDDTCSSPGLSCT